MANFFLITIHPSIRSFLTDPKAENRTQSRQWWQYVLHKWPMYRSTIGARTPGLHSDSSKATDDEISSEGS